MHSLFNGLLSLDKMCIVEEYTRIRFKNPEILRLADTVTMFEQKLLSESDLLSVSERITETKMSTPSLSYVPEDIIESLSGTNLVPVLYKPSQALIVCAVTPDIETKQGYYPNHSIETLYVPLYHYLALYLQLYGEHPCTYPIPVKQTIESIFDEAVDLGAADITISTLGKSAAVYYNVRKRKVYSNRRLAAEDIKNVIKFISRDSPYNFDSHDPAYIGITINKEYRGRVIINKKYEGYMITIRMLPNTIFHSDFTSLNISVKSQEFITQKLMDMENGLRLLVGETFSGKNTTILSILSLLNKDNKYKIVSVERPVEQVLPSIEQINCTSDEEYIKNLMSLIRQNPDMVYITEIQESTALQVLKETNTGKRIFSTLHANSASDAVVRLMDITGLTIDRILPTLHSIVYQKLLRNEETDSLYPVLRGIRFTDELKYNLIGLPLGQVLKTLRSHEECDELPCQAILNINS